MTEESKVRRLAYWLLKDVNKAIRDFKMINAGDRVAVAVSGSKDSLSLLRLLDWRREFEQHDYDIAAIHVNGDANGPRKTPHQPLLDWFEQNEYTYAVEPIYLPANEPLPMDCHRCTWNRRRTIFETADRLGCNLVAMGHHGDDLAETTLLNLLYHGRVETMAPKAAYFDGVFDLIRPLCYLPKADIRRFARACDFPEAPPACSQADDNQRTLIRQLIQKAEESCQDARVNLLQAGLEGIRAGES